MACSQSARIILEIISSKGVSPNAWSELLRSVPLEDVSGMLATPEGRERLSRILKRAVAAPNPAFVERQLRRLEAGGYGVVSFLDEEYPRLLARIQEPPPVLFYKGDLEVLSRPTICVVGSRSATRRGIVTARELSRDLSRRGFHVVSGLARGIDGAAHEGAIGGAGGTSAVLGSGVDVIYPLEHRRLAECVAHSGCLLSEFPLGTSPYRYNFPARNRILSGLSWGVVVVEAAKDSGAMGTAGWAADQGREVFAVPGPIDDPRTRGPHQLIRDGAHLVESADDIVEVYARERNKGAGGVQVEAAQASASVEPAGAARSMGAAAFGRSIPLDLFGPEERAVIEALSLDPKHIDELVQFCHISPAIILPILLDLEMRGVIASCGGGTYALAAPAG